MQEIIKQFNFSDLPLGFMVMVFFIYYLLKKEQQTQRTIIRVIRANTKAMNFLAEALISKTEVGKTINRKKLLDIAFGDDDEEPKDPSALL